MTGYAQTHFKDTVKDIDKQENDEVLVRITSPENPIDITQQSVMSKIDCLVDSACFHLIVIDNHKNHHVALKPGIDSDAEQDCEPGNAK
ncbi:hypothetical protein LTR05_006334 [Lithohypha guttulata]|uniref:Uncharacterized protein n=1 Tax=Lithohypha guttulata TaxID=1690604 RepID=A0AAN7SX33_9EURO|nr:hypothetical protein LTR05_006334 [Lithohypha guttulata]